MIIDKQAVIEQITAQLEHDRQVALNAVQTAREAATHEESKAENKYDTRGLEASYLAHGQARRLEEITQALARYRGWAAVAHDPVSGIRTGDLLNLAAANGQTQWLFLGPNAAGLVLACTFGACTVITLQAPLGQALRGHGEGDVVRLVLGGQQTLYEIIEAH